METGMIIGTIIALVIIVVLFVIYQNTKDRKKTLTIMKDGDTIRLLLSDAEYCEFDIFDIKENQKRIDEELIKVVENRSRELARFVDRVTSFKDGNKAFEEKLLNIIMSENNSK